MAFTGSILFREDPKLKLQYLYSGYYVYSIIDMPQFSGRERSMEALDFKPAPMIPRINENIRPYVKLDIKPNSRNSIGGCHH